MARIIRMRSEGRVDVSGLDAAQGARVFCRGGHGRVVALRDATTEVLLCGDAPVQVGDFVEVLLVPPRSPGWRAGSVLTPDGFPLFPTPDVAAPIHERPSKRPLRWRTGVAAADLSRSPDHGSAVLALLDTPAALDAFVAAVMAQQRLDHVDVVRLTVANTPPLGNEGATTISAPLRAISGLPFALQTMRALATSQSESGRDVLIVVDDFVWWRKYAELMAQLTHEARSKPLADLLGACRRFGDCGRVSVLCVTTGEPTKGFDAVWNLRSIGLPGGLMRWLLGREGTIPYSVGDIYVSFGGHQSLGSILRWRLRLYLAEHFVAWVIARGSRHITPLALVLAVIRCVSDAPPLDPPALDAWIIGAETALTMSFPGVVAQVSKTRGWHEDESRAVEAFVQQLIDHAGPSGARA